MHSPEDLRSQAVLVAEEGDSLVGYYASAKVGALGIYKLIIVKRKSGLYDWAHFVERESGARHDFFRGNFEEWELKDKLVDGINETLSKTFGAAAKLQVAKLVVNL